MASIPQCGVCLEEYNHEDAHRQPHGLRCGHSFCAQCVEGLIARNHRHVAVCPKCRRETAETDVHVNYGLRDIVEQLRAAAGAPTTTQEAADFAMAVRLSNKINNRRPLPSSDEGMAAPSAPPAPPPPADHHHEGRKVQACRQALEATLRRKATHRHSRVSAILRRWAPLPVPASDAFTHSALYVTDFRPHGSLVE
ncbi:unnamed protein product [Vitrella brassicaformis CCMP3155]|uniref:RING-type domain-containing protein n=1 Tax=Vitrella brassicaformis (strain CCMP3155) TaxID=1169540 RepID=A0A0G4F2J1_VITBC|nr:unnamed protein product [Vitrella brassicaformis CCMP3155]|eukprot:CEM05764.1 unnamed protein product [Vitrella brassicaformis CCMP3155]